MDRHIQRCREIAKELRSPVLDLWTSEVLLEHAMAAGKWDTGIALGEQAVARARSLGQDPLLPRLLVWLSLIYLGRGEIERGRACVDEAWTMSGADRATTHECTSWCRLISGGPLTMWPPESMRRRSASVKPGWQSQRTPASSPETSQNPLNRTDTPNTHGSGGSGSRRSRPEARPKVGTFVNGFHNAPHWRRSAPDPFRELIDRIFDDAGAWWPRSQQSAGGA